MTTKSKAKILDMEPVGPGPAAGIGLSDIATIQKAPDVKRILKEADNFLATVKVFQVTDKDSHAIAVNYGKEADVKAKQIKAMIEHYTGGVAAWIKDVKALFSPKVDAYAAAKKEAVDKAVAYQVAEMERADAKRKEIEAAQALERSKVHTKAIRDLVNKIGVDFNTLKSWIKKEYRVELEDIQDKFLLPLGEAALEEIKEKLIRRAEKEKPEAAAAIQKIADREAPVQAPVAVQAPANTTKTGEASLTLRGRTVYEVTDFEKIPPAYKKTVLDEEKIAEAVDAGLGESIPGIRVFKKYGGALK